MSSSIEKYVTRRNHYIVNLLLFHQHKKICYSDTIIMVNITANNDKYAVKSVNIYTHSHISFWRLHSRWLALTSLNKDKGMNVSLCVVLYQYFEHNSQQN